jgi:Zn-dependent M28 family amino/carboxypeptidase
MYMSFISLFTKQDLKAISHDSALNEAFQGIEASSLQAGVEKLAFPRHYRAEYLNNQQAAGIITKEFQDVGYRTLSVGRYYNVVAYSPESVNKPVILLGAHFDGVPGCIAADDNASAVAGLLAVAKQLRQSHPQLNVVFAAFNREEDGYFGSKEVVRYFNQQQLFTVREAHVLEMIGYASDKPGSQKFPPGIFPEQSYSVGDFIAILSNSAAEPLLIDTLSIGEQYVPKFKGLGIQHDPSALNDIRPVYDLYRSDHRSFWQNGVPALLWTDTAEFRTPHYHQTSDTPDTLNYSFMEAVTRAVLGTIIHRAQILGLESPRVR